MNDAIFTFRSYSGAAKTYDIFKMNSIPSKIHRTAAGSAGSCGFSVRIPAENASFARDLLWRNGVVYDRLTYR